MNRVMSVCVGGLLLGGLWMTAPALAQDQQEDALEQAFLPSFQQVLRNHVNARGGPEAILEKETLIARGTYDTFDDGRTAIVEYRAGTDMRQFMKIEFPGEMLLAGCDGEERWRITPEMGALVMGPPEGRTRMNYDIHRDLRYTSYFPNIEVIGLAIFDDRECYEVRMTGRSGRSGLMEYYDVETGLRAGSKKTIRLESGLGEEMEVLRNWKEVDGVKYPMTQLTYIRRPGRLEPVLLTRLNFDSLKWNTLNDEHFAVPEGIRVDAGEMTEDVDPEDVVNDAPEDEEPGEGGS